MKSIVQSAKQKKAEKGSKSNWPMESENFSSGFTTGPSLGCMFGTYMVSVDRTPVCAKPPKPKPAVIYRPTYTGVRSHIAKWKLKKKPSNWNPFDRLFQKRKNSTGFKTTRRFKIQGSEEDDSSCYRDQLGQCVSCKEGFYFSKGGATFNFSSNAPYTFNQTHANSGCHKCPADCKFCDKRGCSECSVNYEYNYEEKRCLVCEHNKVYDPFAKRCFTEKQNNF